MTSRKPPSLRRKWLIGDGVGLVVLLGDAYTAAYLLAGDKVPANTTVEGVATSELHSTDAEQHLRTELRTRYEVVLTVTDDKGHSVGLASLEGGLSVDYAGAVKAAGGASLNPVDVFRTLLGDDPTKLPKNISSEKLKETLTTHAPIFQVEGINATLAFVDGTVSHTESTDSTVLNVDAIDASVIKAVKSSTREVATVTKVQAPVVISAMVDEAVASFATPALSGPVAVKVHDKSFQVSPEQVASVTTFAVKDDKLVPHISPEQLLKVTAKARAGPGLVTSKDAGYTLKGDTIEVVSVGSDQQLDVKGLVEGVAEATTQSDEAWTAAVKMIDRSAEFSIERMESLKPTQVIEEFATYYPHANYRSKNPERATELIGDKVLLPGGTFSLNDTLRPRIPANGFTDSYIINDGLLVKESGDGIFQATTTMYSASFFAGYRGVEHRSHTLCFDRYPAGHEATIYYSSFDIKFKNSTSYPAYIQGLDTPFTASNRGGLTFRI